MFHLVAHATLSLNQQHGLFTGLAQVVRSGVPLSAGLSHVQEGIGSRHLAESLGRMSRAITDRGLSLAQCFSTFMPGLPPLFLALIEQGETGGSLEYSLQEIVSIIETSQARRRQLISAMAYPCTVFLLSIFLLPIPLAFSSGWPAYILAVLPWILLLGGGIIYGLTLWPRTHLNDAPALTRDRMLVQMPFIGRLFRKIVLARFARALGAMTRSGFPMDRALELASISAGNRYLRIQMLMTKEAVSRGACLSDELSRLPGLFPPSFISMVKTGEASGQLDETLSSLGSLYETESQVALDTLTKMLGPLIGVLVLGMIGYRIISFYMARFAVLDGLL